MSTRARVVVVCALLAVTSRPAVAQPAAAFGKPLLSPDLATGTVVVRVIDGGLDAPHPGASVTLSGDGAPRTAKTDDAGRARFEGLTVGATVTARVSVRPAVTSDSMVVPDEGGLRVILSTRPLKPTPRPARKQSGKVHELDKYGGMVEVRVSYDDLADAHPPAGVRVSLVGYAADDSVRLEQQKTDAQGVARFVNLDETGAVAYYALAQLPRKRAADRLLSAPIVLREKHGAEVVLSGELRTATSPPLDELVERDEWPSEDKLPAVARGKLRVRLDGNAAVSATPVRVLDGATGKQVAQGVVPDKELVLGVPVRAGQVLYVEATSGGQRVRSLPFEMVGDRGAGVTLDLSPRPAASYRLMGFADDAALVLTMDVKLENPSWAPYRGPGDMRIPLPAGATAIDLLGSEAAVIHGANLEVTRPLPPGGLNLGAGFDLPAKAGEVSIALDLPLGAQVGLVAIDDEPGLSIDHLPSGAHQRVVTAGQRTYQLVEDIARLPNQSFAMTVHLPSPRPEVSLQHACRRLGPDPTALVGQTLDFTLNRLDGRALKLSSLRGKPVLVNMTATWNSISKNELPKLAALTRQLSVVLLASDTDPKAVIAELGPQPFPIVLDPPSKPDDNIGAVTKSWGVNLVPETVRLDRKGVVRFHFQNTREWDSPEAQRCLKAFLAAP